MTVWPRVYWCDDLIDGSLLSYCSDPPSLLVHPTRWGALTESQRHNAICSLLGSERGGYRRTVLCHGPNGAPLSQVSLLFWTRLEQLGLSSKAELVSV